MNPHNPTETSPGKMYARDDLLRQEAHSGRAGRMARWVRTIARVAFVLLIVGILAATVVGPGRAIDWIGSYLVPVAVKLGVITAVLALLVG